MVMDACMDAGSWKLEVENERPLVIARLAKSAEAIPYNYLRKGK